MDLKQKAFVIYVATLITLMPIHLARKAWIIALITNEAPVIVLVEYLNFGDIFSKEFATILLKHIEINIHAIDLKTDKQPTHRPIYSLGQWSQKS